MQKWLPFFALMFFFQLSLPGWTANVSYDAAQSSAVARAPFLKPTIDAWLSRLSIDQDPAPACREFTRLICHYNPALDSHEYYQELLARYNAADAPVLNEGIDLHKTAAGTQFKVNDGAGDCWYVNTAQSLSSQLILTVWQDERRGVDNPDIYGQFFDLSMNPLGGNFLVHAENGDVAQNVPAVAAMPDGGFMVVWVDYRGATGVVYGRRFKSDRAPDGVEFQIAVAGDPQLAPALAADLAGHFTVTWLQENAGDYNVYARQFSNTQTPITPAFLVNDNRAAFQWFPVIAASPGGEALIVWEDKRDNNSDIYAQRLRADGSKRAGNFRVDDTSDRSRQWLPVVATGAGQFVVAWEDYRDDPFGIYAQWFDASLLLDGANQRVDDFAMAAQKELPSVAMNAAGESLFCWQDGRDGVRHIFAQAFDATKNAAAFFALAESDDTVEQNLPKVVMNDRMLSFFWLEEASDSAPLTVTGSQLLWSNVPVELVDFSAKVDGTTVTCAWTTLTETNNLGYAVERSRDGIVFIQIGLVQGNGTTTTRHNYAFVDAGAPAGVLFYRLKQVDFDGAARYSTIEKVFSKTPYTLALSGNYPNPFNPTTTVSYQLPENSRVEITVYDMAGRFIKSLFQGEQNAGRYEAEWDGADLRGQACNSGIYLCRIKAGAQTDVIKMTLIK